MCCAALLNLFAPTVVCGIFRVFCAVNHLQSSSLPIWSAFCLSDLSCLTSLAWVSSIMLSRNDKRGHFVLEEKLSASYL